MPETVTRLPGEWWEMFSKDTPHPAAIKTFARKYGRPPARVGHEGRYLYAGPCPTDQHGYRLLTNAYQGETNDK